ncbi:hypothetical protein IWQ57_002855, partial [Coemansia nantahalensis]
EVDMPCVTPTNADPIPAGESFTIAQTLQRTAGGSLEPPRALTAEDFAVSSNHLPLTAVGADPLPEPAPGTSLPVAEPDPIWLTAQMLSTPAEIEELLSAAKKASRGAATKKYATARTVIRRVATKVEGRQKTT